jgi:hypothetical protein
MKTEGMNSTKSTIDSIANRFANKLRDKISATAASEFHFKIAERKEELESACRLVHDNYIRNGYMTPQESGLRLTLRNALPETTTFIGKKSQRVVSTMTVFQDSGLGLPMDAIYKRETDTLRARGRKIVEAGSLANHPDIPKTDQSVLMHVFKTMFHYCRDYLNVDDLVIAVNPKHRWFYEHVLLYEQIGDMKPYEYVNNAPAQAYRLDLRTLETRYREVYRDKPIEKNLYRFFFRDKSTCISLPEANRSICFWSKDHIRYFFEEKTRLFTEASKEALECLHTQYECRKANANDIPFPTPLSIIKGRLLAAA